MSLLPPDPLDAPQAVPDTPRAHAVRVCLFIAGSIAFVLGIIGVVLPLMPSVPLFILAAACFARAYQPFHQWMLDHRWIGPPLRDWYRHRSLRPGIKWLALASLAVSCTVSIVWFADTLWLKGLIAAFVAVVAVVLWRIPTRSASHD